MLLTSCQIEYYFGNEIINSSKFNEFKFEHHQPKKKGVNLIEVNSKINFTERFVVLDLCVFFLLNVLSVLLLGKSLISQKLWIHPLQWSIFVCLWSLYSISVVFATLMMGCVIL